MEHLDFENFIEEYLAGSLSSSQKDEMEAHLAVCASCGARLEQARLIQSALSALPEVAPPADLAAWFHENAPARRRTVPARLTAMAAAVVLVLCLGAAGLSLGLGRQKMSNSAAPEAAPDLLYSIAAQDDAATGSDDAEAWGGSGDLAEGPADTSVPESSVRGVAPEDENDLRGKSLEEEPETAGAQEGIEAPTDAAIPENELDTTLLADSGRSASPIPPWLWAGSGVLLVGAVAVPVLLFRRRKK